MRVREPVFSSYLVDVALLGFEASGELFLVGLADELTGEVAQVGANLVVLSRDCERSEASGGDGRVLGEDLVLELMREGRRASVVDSARAEESLAHLIAPRHELYELGLGENLLALSEGERPITDASRGHASEADARLYECRGRQQRRAETAQAEERTLMASRSSSRPWIKAWVST